MVVLQRLSQYVLSFALCILDCKPFTFKNTVFCILSINARKPIKAEFDSYENKRTTVVHRHIDY